MGKRRTTRRSLNVNSGRETRSRLSGSRNTPGGGEYVNNYGGGQVNHLNAAVNHESAPTSATNNARDNVTEAGSSIQPEAPAHVAAAASNSGGGSCVQAVNLAHGIPDVGSSYTRIIGVIGNLRGVSM